MTYDPVRYWQAAGADPANSEHESHFVRTDVFARQEERLLETLRGLEFGSLLEVGCGWGRITKLVHDEWPDVPYDAIDLSPDRIRSARSKAPDVMFYATTIQDFEAWERWDLILTTECLMHVPPDQIEAVAAKLMRLSSCYVVSLDWTADLGSAPVAPWNFRHPYEQLYGFRLLSVTPTDLQSIFVVDAIGTTG